MFVVLTDVCWMFEFTCDLHEMTLGGRTVLWNEAWADTMVRIDEVYVGVWDTVVELDEDIKVLTWWCLEMNYF